jgi:SAM-dependent methyltransferase
MPDGMRITPAEALDAAFAGVPCDLVRADGGTKVFAAHRWTGTASSVELALFVDPCTGSTLDVGCGPGRLTAALARKGLPALGIDISAEAVRLTRQRGGAAVQQDAFDELPGASRWRHVLLADGNVGLGGDPVRLLRFLRRHLEPGGTMLVEVAGPGVRGNRHQVQLRVADQLCEPFDWATVGIDEVEHLASLAGMALCGTRSLGGRHVATLGAISGAH